MPRRFTTRGRDVGDRREGNLQNCSAAPKEHLENINKVYQTSTDNTLPKALKRNWVVSWSLAVRDATLLTTIAAENLSPTKPQEPIKKPHMRWYGYGRIAAQYYHSLPRSDGGSQRRHIELLLAPIHERVRKETGGKYKELLLQILNTVCRRKDG
jgi:hypothetical protein